MNLFYLQFNVLSISHVLVLNQFLQFSYAMIGNAFAKTTRNRFKYTHRY